MSSASDGKQVPEPMFVIQEGGLLGGHLLTAHPSSYVARLRDEVRRKLAAGSRSTLRVVLDVLDHMSS
jgi:hypothetical protein